MPLIHDFKALKFSEMLNTKNFSIKKINFKLNKFIINNRSGRETTNGVYKHSAESVECKRKIVNKTCLQ